MIVLEMMEVHNSPDSATILLTLIRDLGLKPRLLFTKWPVTILWPKK